MLWVESMAGGGLGYAVLHIYYAFDSTSYLLSSLVCYIVLHCVEEGSRAAFTKLQSLVHSCHQAPGYRKAGGTEDQELIFSEDGAFAS